MTQVQQMAALVQRASFDEISEAAKHHLKMHILDTLGCALAVLGEGPLRATRAQADEFGGDGPCTLIGGGKASPPCAAFYNTTLTRYLDFMDNYLGESETCHPCDNLASVLAATEYAGGSGKDLMTALAVAYQVQCRMTGAAPIMQRGFDHTTQLSFSLAAGVAKALGMDAEQTANAIALCGAEHNALAVIRAVPISQWKGLASSQTALGCVHATFLARRGVTGPLGVFEGPKGFQNAIGEPVDVEWTKEDLEIVTQTLLKSYNSEVHTQPAIQCLLELREAQPFTAGEVARIELETFEVAYNITGGGEYGPKYDVETKEQADHSLPYVLAVAALDGDVQPEQFAPERIRRGDVQALLRRVSVRPDKEMTKRYPEKMPARVTVHLTDGRVLAHEVRDYPGFNSRPFSWEQCVAKFERIASPHTSERQRRQVIAAVADLENIAAADLTAALGQTRH
ncbi:MAG: MmgE/PrpD family protein [Armatimonadetes bacterium]|nr:MmgE/PrpD family protein [Armatimonadota bacterium]